MLMKSVTPVRSHDNLSSCQFAVFYSRRFLRLAQLHPRSPQAVKLSRVTFFSSQSADARSHALLSRYFRFLFRFEFKLVVGLYYPAKKVMFLPLCVCVSRIFYEFFWTCGM